MCPNQRQANCCNNPSVLSGCVWDLVHHHGKHTALLRCEPCSSCLELQSLQAPMSSAVCGYLVSEEIEHERKGEKILYSKPPNGMHFLGLPIGRNMVICSSPMCKRAGKYSLWLRKMSHQLLCCEGAYDSLVVFSTSPTQAKSKQLNKARH